MNHKEDLLKFLHTTNIMDLINNPKYHSSKIKIIRFIINHIDDIADISIKNGILYSNDHLPFGWKYEVRLNTLRRLSSNKIHFDKAFEQLRISVL